MILFYGSVHLLYISIEGIFLITPPTSSIIPNWRDFHQIVEALYREHPVSLSILISIDLIVDISIILDNTVHYITLIDCCGNEMKEAVDESSLS